MEDERGEQGSLKGEVRQGSLKGKVRLHLNDLPPKKKNGQAQLFQDCVHQPVMVVNRGPCHLQRGGVTGELFGHM